MIQDRDRAIFDFLGKFKVATTSQIEREFFMKQQQKQSLWLAQRRLKKLHEAKYLVRQRNHLNDEYAYSLKKYKQIDHQVALVEFYLTLKKYGRINEFTPEKTMGDIRPDAVCEIYVPQKGTYFFCVEVEMSNNRFNQDKYEKFYYSRAYKKWFPVTFPKIVIICDRTIKIKPSRVNYVQIPTNLKGIEKIF